MQCSGNGYCHCVALKCFIVNGCCERKMEVRATTEKVLFLDGSLKEHHEKRSDIFLESVTRIAFLLWRLVLYVLAP